MKKLAFTLIIPYILLTLSIAFAVDKEKRSYMYYWEKGNKGEPISIEELNYLIEQLGIRINSLKLAFAKIQIEDGNFSYKRGKSLEIQLESIKKDLDSCKSYLGVVKDNPNLIAPSLAFYILLTDAIYTNAYDFSRISIYEAILNDKVFELLFWNVAFRKAHLYILALTIDQNVKLYKK